MIQDSACIEAYCICYGSSTCIFTAPKWHDGVCMKSLATTRMTEETTSEDPGRKMHTT